MFRPHSSELQTILILCCVCYEACKHAYMWGSGGVAFVRLVFSGRDARTFSPGFGGSGDWGCVDDASRSLGVRTRLRWRRSAV